MANVPLDSNETPQQILYSTGDSNGNHIVLTVADKSNIRNFYQLSSIQSGGQPIPSGAKVVYSRDNLY